MFSKLEKLRSCSTTAAVLNFKKVCDSRHNRKRSDKTNISRLLRLSVKQSENLSFNRAFILNYVKVH